ncbi:hypothetical protein NSK_007477 [Nannochloropsis salina CCMP1776]|uniref:Uncharacterized protein n=1 Tax=Nannochloropsis salina CCMP1776 TaxID=1027361 RepID=A0A4D9CT34_9STRA|nr:hypothetical protein NSK_007477 [Nannochloropsis salina CCMP1776]|eukprot:TFJ81187.1 hypothetical protein NSK_007477 [Nannochloropsis salina CCMP1776]
MGETPQMGDISNAGSTDKASLKNTLSPPRYSPSSGAAPTSMSSSPSRGARRRDEEREEEEEARAESVEVAIVGAGFAGICVAIKLKEAGFKPICVFEKNADVGGTWHVNTYPGCACDVPSHLYSLSFEQKADWSRHLFLNHSAPVVGNMGRRDPGHVLHAHHSS